MLLKPAHLLTSFIRNLWNSLCLITQEGERRHIFAPEGKTVRMLMWNIAKCAILVSAAFLLSETSSLKLLPLNKQSRQPFTVMKVDLNAIQEAQEPIIIEIICKQTAEKTKSKSMSYSSTYKENKEDKVLNVLDSPIFKVFGVLLNPTTLLLALYFSSIGWSQVLWLQKILNVFGKGSLVKKEDGTEESAASAALKALPFQTFECEVCNTDIKIS